MLYGGRLLSHLTLDGADELIDLLKVCKQAAIVIDSDKRAPNDNINLTKRRIQTECAVAEHLCWITEGRTIENYLPEKATTKLAQKFGTPEKVDAYDNLFGDSNANKVAFAKEALPSLDSLNVLDLRTRIEALSNKIRTAGRE